MALNDSSIISIFFNNKLTSATSTQYKWVRCAKWAGYVRFRQNLGGNRQVRRPWSFGFFNSSTALVGERSSTPQQVLQLFWRISYYIFMHSTAIGKREEYGLPKWNIAYVQLEWKCLRYCKWRENCKLVDWQTDYDDRRLWRLLTLRLRYAGSNYAKSSLLSTVNGWWLYGRPEGAILNRVMCQLA